MCRVHYENDADKIIKNLWLGNYHSALNLDFLTKHNIKVIINITNDIPCRFEHMNYIHWKVYDQMVCQRRDMINIIDDIVDHIYIALKHNHGVLVHCKNGHHRSASIIMAFLMRYFGLNFGQSMQYIKSIRPYALNRNTCMVGIVYYYYLHLGGQSHPISPLPLKGTKSPNQNRTKLSKRGGT